MAGILNELRRVKWAMRVALVRGGQRWRFRQLRRRHLPILFGNSMAKSGSHVLAQFLEGLTLVSPLVFTDAHGIRTQDSRGLPRSTGSVMRDLRRLKAGDIGWGYIPSQAEYVAYLTQPSVRMIFVYRDPRDKIISHILYATGIHQGHAMRAFYESLPTMEERISATIAGVPGMVENVRQTYESYLGWLDEPLVVKVKFEDFVNEQPATVERLLEELAGAGVPLSVSTGDAVSRVVQAMAPEKSPTFRSGTSGEWERHFTAKNRKEFEEVAGNLLERLGYSA